MKRFALVFLCALGPLLFSPQVLHATTLIVGTCKPSLPSYATISLAVAAAPTGATVEVCPGTYAEQVSIATPLTLEGITIGNSNRAIIVPPLGGSVANWTNLLGQPVAAQVLVTATTGPVNITNITVDGTNNDLSGSAWLAGIFYGSGSYGGTVNQVTTRYQIDSDQGEGIWAENGTSNPETVTIEGCTIHDVDNIGIVMLNDEAATELTFTVKGNTVAGESVGPSIGIANLYATGSMVSNVVSDFVTGGIVDEGSTVLITDNTTTNTEANSSNEGGILLAGTGETAKANTVLNNNVSGASGIYIDTQASSPTIQGNKIADSSVAIEFSCTSAAVSGNTISDAATALDQVPSTVASTNLYYGVSAIRTECTAAGAATDAAAVAKGTAVKAASPLKKLRVSL